MVIEEKLHETKLGLEQHMRMSCLETPLKATMTKMLRHKMEVAEVYSPPRVVAMASKMGLRQGWGMDLTTMDVDGRAWDSNQKEMRNRAVRGLLRDKPLVLVGSLMCVPFSIMNSINYSRMDPSEVEQRKEHGRRHLQFCTRLYKLQVDGGRYLTHEHPQSASSWHEGCIQKLLKEEGVQRVVGDQCMYGLKAREGNRIGPARKGTGFSTNSPFVAKRLCNRCPNWDGQRVCNHVRLDNGKAAKAQVYPDELCQAICQGIRDRMEVDRAGQFVIMNIHNQDHTIAQSLKQEAHDIKRQYKTVEEEDH